MAKAFGSQIDLQKIPVKGIVVEQLASPGPTSPVNGQLWYDLTAGVTKCYDSGAWVLVGNAAGGSTPTGPAGGDLTGSTYPNPTIANSVITSAKIVDGTIVDGDVATANKDGVAGTYSMRTLGTGAQQAAAGNDSRLSDSRVPTGAAAGDLSGTYPSPTIGTGKVTTTHILDGTITDTDVNAANKDGANATYCMRRLGVSAGMAFPGNYDMSQIAVPLNSIDMNNQLVRNVLAPILGTDAANKAYVDAAVQGLDIKNSCVVATTANIALTGTQTIDTIAVNAGDRVLVRAQTDGTQNGIYVVAAGAWARATDFDTSAEASPGAFTFVEQGLSFADTGWVMSTNAPIVLGTTTLAWTQFSGAGTFNAGAGLTKTGNTFDVVGTAARILVNADNIDIDAGYVGQTSITTLGTIGTGSWNATAIPMNKGGTGGTDAATARASLGAVGKSAGTIAGAMTAGVEVTFAHNLNTKDIVPSFRLVSNDNAVEFAWRAVDVNTIGITADVTGVYTANTVRVVVVG